MTRQNRRFCLWIAQSAVVGMLALPVIAQTPTPAEPAKQPAQSAAGAASNPTPSTPLPASGSVKLGPGDLIEFSVFGVPDLNTKVRITNSGDVYLPLIDYVHIADLTTDEAQELIEKRLEAGGFVRNPHVSLFVDESASQAVSVLGEVNKPGPYPAIGDRRLFDLISAAGGMTDKAGRTVTIVPRDKPDQKTEVHLAANLAEDTEHNIEINPGDTIIVSRAGIVYVVGDVGRPSGFSIEDDTLTVLKALALAGGQTRTSSLNGAKLIRQTPSGVQEISVPLKKIIEAKASDVPMVRGDVLFVPGSAAKAFAYRGVEAAISMTTALTVLAVQ